MKTRKLSTTLPVKVLREFEAFYNGMAGESAKHASRRLRDMLLEYWKTDSAGEDVYVEQLMSDMYFYFLLLDACEDGN
jgi:hypothetical protein